MADTYTAALKARKIEQGAYSNSYATRFNEDMVDVFDAAIAGVLEIDIGSSTTHALEAMQNGTLSDSHYFHLRFVGTPASAVTVTVPASVTPSKEYLVENQTGQALTIKYAATSGVTVQDEDTVSVRCDGTTVTEAVFSPRFKRTTAEIAAGVTPTNFSYPPGNVKRYGAVGDGVTDDAPAFQKAINLAKFSGEALVIPAPPDGGAYLLLSALNCTQTVDDTNNVVNSRMFTIRGEGNLFVGSTHVGVRPVLLAKHTGHVFDCTGSYGLNFENVSVGTDDTTYPKTCFFFARNATASSSNFRVTKCRVSGKFSESIVYNYGAEEDQYDGCLFKNTEGGANAKVLTFTGYNYRNLTSSFAAIATGQQSTIAHWIFGGSFYNFSRNAAADVCYLEGGAHLTRIFGGHWICADTIGGGRSYFYMDSTNAVSNELLLIGCGGEASIIQPSYGLYIGDAVGSVGGLSVQDVRFTNSGNTIKTHANITVSGARLFGVNNASLGGGIDIDGTMLASYHDNPAGGLTVGTYTLNNVIGRQGESNLIIADGSAAAGKKYWQHRSVGGQYAIAAIADNGTTNLGNCFIATSSGSAVSNVAFDASTYSVGVAGLPNFANDAAAAAGGVPVGNLYRNGSIVMVRVA